MKKWIILWITIVFSGLIFWSCSDDNPSEPEKDTTAPTVNILYPANNAEFQEGTTIILKADAIDNESVTKVEFYIDGEIEGSVDSLPYQISWMTTGKVGYHSIMGKAYDSSDNKGSSSVISVKINVNDAPVINSLTAEPATVLQGGTSVLTCSADDMNGDSLTYIWSASAGILSGTGSIRTWTAPDILDTYTIICTVNDGILSDTDTVSVIVADAPAGFVHISGGTFTMGDNFSEGFSNELPLHTVTLSEYYIGTTEVTQAEWTDVMGSNPASGYGVGDTYPVYYVSWYSIIKYCNLRSMNEGLTPCYTINNSTDPADWGAVPNNYDAVWDAVVCNWSAKGYRLPKEAEWEYAARGGLSGQRFPNGATISHSTNGDTQANYYASTSYTYDVSPTTGYHPQYNGKSSPVGSFPANGYGISDLAGNLFEWCWDFNGSYISDSQTDPTGPETGTLYRIIRGGGLNGYATSCRVAYRATDAASTSQFYYGFRLSRTP
ncbi:MAG TPA: SUMF1/EgtB/PvdO family nonheme iron enzyme [Clostridiales bacterium]|nr:SUMF1/EgtB/PvdO family nonheme iron enzyme [Clostridiales bacterium]